MEERLKTLLLLYESWGNMTFWLRFAAAVSTVALSLVSVGTSVDLHTAVTALQTNTSSTVAANTVTTDESSESVTDGTMPDNPTVALPETVDESISSDATVVAPDIAITNDGVAVDLQSGNEITDVEKVGDENTQPDPLAKTDGESFTPVDIETVRDAVEQQAEANGTAETVKPNETNGTNKTAAWSDTKENLRHSAVTAVEKTQSNEQQGGRVSTVALGNNEYGAYWGSYSGKPAFFESNKNPYIQDAKGVVDVSAWQGTIDWQKAKAAGVQGAIIRISYGWDNGFDPYALRNIRECKRLGIPFGVYSYSYSYDAASARAEGNDMVSLLRKAGVSPKDLGYPVFYDLEKWVWKGHNPPTNPAVYEQIVNTWMNIVRGAGYDGQVYSYANYIKNELNRSSIHKRVGWVASYGARAGFDISLDKRGWQYTSAGKVAGIAGNVDLNAFGVKKIATTNNGNSNSGGNNSNKPTQPAQPSNAYNVTKLPKVVVPNGTYYINSYAKYSSSIDIPGGSTSNGAKTQLYSWNNSQAQQFRFTRQNDGSYEIVNVKSGKALDVYNAEAKNFAVVQQFSRNGTVAQRWFLRDAGSYYYLQSALGNWVLDLTGGNTSNGTAAALYTPNQSAAQRFTLASANTAIPTGANTWIANVRDHNMVFDISGGSTSNTARVQLYRWNATGAQLYRFAQVGNGTYTITNVKSGKLVEIGGGAMGNGGAVQQYVDNGTVAQRWFARKVGNGISFFNVKSGKVIDIPAANMYSGNKLQSFSTNGTAAQQWVVGVWKTPRDKLNELAASHRKDLPDGTVVLATANNTSKVLDVSNGSRNNAANVWLYQSNGTNAQKWRVRHDGAGYVTLINVGSGKALDIRGAGTADGTNVQQYANNGTWAQKWIAVKQGDGSVVLYSALAENKVLDVSGGSTLNRANVQLWSANGTKAQRWYAMY